jgi:hypothetical protein
MDVRLHKKGHETNMNSPDDKTEIAGPNTGKLLSSEKTPRVFFALRL